MTSSSIKKRPKPSKEEVVAAFEKYQTVRRMAEHFGVTNQTARAWAEGYGIDTKPKKLGVARVSPTVSKEDLAALIVAQGGISGAARVLGRSRALVRSWADGFGLVPAAPYQQVASGDKGLPATEVLTLYTRGRSDEEQARVQRAFRIHGTYAGAARELGCSQVTAKKLAARYGIALLSLRIKTQWIDLAALNDALTSTPNTI